MNYAQIFPQVSARANGEHHPHHSAQPHKSNLFTNGKDVPNTPYRCVVLQHPDDLMQAYRLRYDVFCNEMKVIDPTTCLQEMEFDHYDEKAIHVALMHGGEIITYARLISPEDTLPIEKAVSLPYELFDRNRVFEISRALIPKSKRRGENASCTWHLFQFVYDLCKELDTDALLSFSNTIMYNGYRKRGVPFRHVGDPTTFHGHKTHPLVIDIRRDHNMNLFLH